MGTDMFTLAQRHTSHGWAEVVLDPAPFDWRSYGLFGFLADVRNLSQVPPISQRRDLPDDHGLPADEVEFDNARTWFTLDELRAYDYEQVFVDRRVVPPAATRLRDFLGTGYFDELERLAAAGVERLILSFSY